MYVEEENHALLDLMQLHQLHYTYIPEEPFDDPCCDWNFVFFFGGLTFKHSLEYVGVAGHGTFKYVTSWWLEKLNFKATNFMFFS